MPASDAATAAPRPTAPVLVGVDAGATKTVAVAVTPAGERLGRAETDGANPKRHGLDVAADRIAAVALAAVALAAVAMEAGADRAPRAAPALVFVAGAGIDRPDHARALEAALVRRLPGTQVLVANDTMAVLRAGTPDAVGLVVPVSTGGNVIGRAADGRVTDRGHGIFGGGYVLGALVARAVRRQHRAGSPLEASSIGSVGSGGSGGFGGSGVGLVGSGGSGGSGGSIGSFGPIARVGPELASEVASAHVEWRGRRPAPEAARLGAAVVAAAQAGDPYPARMIARWGSRVEGAVREEVARLDLGLQPVVILYGGLLDASPWLGGRLRDAVRRGAPGARIQGLDCEPVEGAVLLAIDAWSGGPVRWEFVPRR